MQTWFSCSLPVLRIGCEENVCVLAEHCRQVLCLFSSHHHIVKDPGGPLLGQICQPDIGPDIVSVDLCPTLFSVSSVGPTGLDLGQPSKLP